MNEKYPIYKCDLDDSHRYLMGVDISQNDEIMICIGVNPSTANKEELDPTLTRLNNFCKIYRGVNSKWVMVNLYPQRATNPNELDNCFDESQHKLNIEVFESFLKTLEIINTKNIVILAAWGNLITKRRYLVKCLNDIYTVANQYEWKKIKNTVKGHPKHWIGASYPAVLQDFDITSYIHKFCN